MESSFSAYADKKRKSCDMDCEEAVYSNEYYDFIMEYILETRESPADSCVQKLDENYDIVYLPREGNPPLSINNYSYNAIPACYAPMDESALEVSGILRLQNQPTLGLKGQGVLIGFLDSGIDYESQVFRNSDGSTRIAAIWDQTDRSGTPPSGFIYGSEYQDEKINRALKCETPRDVVPVTDEDGHGTYMASVAAGSEIPEKNFSGAAPYAKIAMVKLKPAKEYLREFYFINPDATAYQENDIMAGVKYLSRLARERHMPLVICVGLGTDLGGHTGTSPLSTMLNFAALQREQAVVIAVGNEGNSRHHYLGELAEDETVQNVEINVGPNVQGFYVEMWAQVPQRFLVDIISPTGERMPSEYILSGGREYSFLFEDTKVSVDYRILGILDGSQVIYIRFSKPTQGLWNIRVYQEGEIGKFFHMWLPLEEFLTGEVFFVRSNPDTTITVPSGAVVPMSVGAYDVRDNSIYLRSGRGFAANGTIKPNFVAPGVEVFGAAPGDMFVTRNGTSAASAVTAGAVALMMEWGIVRGNYSAISGIDIKNMLIRSAERDPKRIYPDRSYGWGRLNLYRAFEEIRIR